MTISLPGVLLRAADACERDADTEPLSGPLLMLLYHLRLVRADPGRIGEFLKVWTDDMEARP